LGRRWDKYVKRLCKTSSFWWEWGCVETSTFLLCAVSIILAFVFLDFRGFWVEVYVEKWIGFDGFGWSYFGGLDSGLHLKGDSPPQFKELIADGQTVGDLIGVVLILIVVIISFHFVSLLSWLFSRAALPFQDLDWIHSLG
jgi:hypothetical protein